MILFDVVVWCGLVWCDMMCPDEMFLQNNLCDGVFNFDKIMFSVKVGRARGKEVV